MLHLKAASSEQKHSLHTGWLTLGCSLCFFKFSSCSFFNLSASSALACLSFSLYSCSLFISQCLNSSFLFLSTFVRSSVVYKGHPTIYYKLNSQFQSYGNMSCLCEIQQAIDYGGIEYNIEYRLQIRLQSVNYRTQNIEYRL